MRNQWSVRFAVLGVLLLSHGWLSANAQNMAYSITDLGTLGGPTSTACGINDLGQIVGRSATASGPVHSFLWGNGSMIDLGTLPQLPFSSARAINNRGQVAGDSTAAGGPPFHAAFWGSGGVTPLGTLPGGFASFAIAVNNRAQVVGASRTANRDVHAFLWQDGEMTDLGTLLATDHQSVARGINSRDQVVGNSSTAIGDPPLPPNRAFVMRDSVFTDLGTLGGNWAIAFSINERDQIVGGSFTSSGELHAFLWQDGTMTDLGTLGGASSVLQPPLPASCNLQPHPGAFGGAVVGAFSLANGINNRGQVVGRSIAAGGADHAFIWHKGVMADLNNSIPSNSGWLLLEAAAINDAGEIVGFGLINGQTRAFLLTPTDD